MTMLCFWEKAKCSSQGAYYQVLNVPNYMIKSEINTVQKLNSELCLIM